MQTKMRAGRLVAAYVADGLGRRLVIGREGDGMFSSIDNVLVVGTTQAEVWETVAVLRQLAEELPPGGTA